MLLLLAGCLQSPPTVDEPDVSYPTVPSGFARDVDWDGRHDLLVLPGGGEPVEVPRQWQRPVPGQVMVIRGPLNNVPTVAIDAQRPWGEVCPHLRPWVARGARPLEPPPHLRVPDPRAADAGAPPPPPPPPAASGSACQPLAVVRGPARPSVPEVPEYPVLQRRMDRLCTGPGPDSVLFEAVITERALTVSAGGTQLTDLVELSRRLRPADRKDVRITAIAPETPWAEVQRGVDELRLAGGSPVWLPPCPPGPSPREL